VESDRLKQHFAEAISLSAEARAAMVAALHSEDPRLAAELLSLLTAHADAGSFLALSPSSSLVRHLENQSSRIGPYRIVRLIARGGMGEVYEAERDDGGAPERVALKMVRLGALSPELIRRFNLERRALARLDHPNIARLLDGGTSDEGIPYLATEFVDGERIDEYCNHHRCSIDQRLKVFLAVCAAVQYAHGRLIVHRDLKPNNILVTPEGNPKLLDFGIAKLLVSEYETPAPDQTRTGANIFTPEYASPEQAGGKEVTTSSDVYSLGVLLYVLLTGQRPYDVSGTKPQDVSAVIQKLDPPRPSNREIQIECLEGKDRVRKRLKGELDTIALTALEKDLSRRYISVEQFAEDIRRHLSHLPIQARPGPIGRRVTKFILRNRVLVGTVAAIFLSLVAGLAVLLYQVRAAHAEKAREESINAFLKQMLTYTNPMQQVPGSSRTSTVMEDALDDAAKRLESDEFARQPEVRVQLERVLGDAYGLQGRYDLMHAHYHKYIQLRGQQSGSNDAESLDTLALWAEEFFANGKLSQSENLFRRTIPEMRAAVNDGNLKAEVFAVALNNFGYLRRTQGDSKEAELAFREVLEISPKFSHDVLFIVGVTRATLASVLADQGRFQEALQTAEEAVAEGRRSGVASTPNFGFVLTIYGGFLTEEGRYAEADSVLKEAYRIYRQMLSLKDLWTADNLRNQAALLYKQNRFSEAIAKAQEALRIYRESFGTHYDNYPTALMIQGLSLDRLGQATEAENLLREAVKLRVELMPPGHFFTALAQSALGEFLTHRLRFAEAESLLIPSYNDLVLSQGGDNPRTTLAKNRVRDLYVAWKKPEEARRFSE
jgi:serine/threonine protein kinase/tetratricopeptide (TPR) repeat protein